MKWLSCTCIMQLYWLIARSTDEKWKKKRKTNTVGLQVSQRLSNVLYFLTTPKVTLLYESNNNRWIRSSELQKHIPWNSSTEDSNTCSMYVWLNEQMMTQITFPLVIFLWIAKEYFKQKDNMIMTLIQRPVLPGKIWQTFFLSVQFISQNWKSFHFYILYTLSQ